ncbi:MAG: hypothetical protein ACP5KY_06425 [Thermoproteus sp.]
MRYRRGDFEASFVRIGGDKYRVELKYRGRPLKIKKIVLEYLVYDRYRYAVDPHSEVLYVFISRTPPVVVKSAWGSSKIMAKAKDGALAAVADVVLDFAEVYMTAYRANALDRLFHED